MQDITERRRHSRLLVSWRGRLDTPAGSLQVRIVDAAQGGFGLLSAQPVKPGTAVQLTASALLTGERLVFRATLQVMHCVFRPSAEHYLIGTAISRIDEQALQRLAGYYTERLKTAVIV